MSAGWKPHNAHFLGALWMVTQDTLRCIWHEGVWHEYVLMLPILL
jgi:hypothetical protein